MTNTINRGNAQTAKTLGTNLTAVVTNVFTSGFNCSTVVEGKKIKTFSPFDGGLGKKGNQVLKKEDIVVGKEVMITTLLENLKPGKDPFATGVVGVMEIVPIIQKIIIIDDEEDNKPITSSYSKKHGCKKPKNKYYYKPRDRRPQGEEKGGANRQRFLEDSEDYSW